MNKLLSSSFVFFSFCPYVSIFPVPSVTQPIAFLFSIVYIIVNKQLLIRKELMIGILPVGIVLVTSVTYIDNIATWRSLIGYLSFFSFCAASYLFFKNREKDQFISVLRLVAWLWFIIGALDFILHKDITAMFKTVQFGALAEGRGVNSLATEPSYYGLICFFMFLFLEILEITDDSRKYFGLKLLLFFQVLLLAQSSITVLYFALYYVIKFTSRKKNLKYLILGVIFMSSVIFIVTKTSFEESTPRIIRLLLLIMENPSKIFMLDLSINHRFTHVLFSLRASFDNFLMPISITEWSSIYDLYVIRYSELVVFSSTTSRIMSGYGSLFFELGFFAFAIIIFVSRAFSYALKGTGTSLRFIFFLNIIMFSAIPIAFPPFGFLIGFLYGNSVGKRCLESKNSV